VVGDEGWRPTKGEQFQVRRDAMDLDELLSPDYWPCALSDKLTERRPAPLRLLHGNQRHVEPSMLIPSARLGEEKNGNG
jgi:hypothetical protein